MRKQQAWKAYWDANKCKCCKRKKEKEAAMIEIPEGLQVDLLADDKAKRESFIKVLKKKKPSCFKRFDNWLRSKLIYQGGLLKNFERNYEFFKEIQMDEFKGLINLTKKTGHSVSRLGAISRLPDHHHT